MPRINGTLNSRKKRDGSVTLLYIKVFMSVMNLRNCFGIFMMFVTAWKLRLHNMYILSENLQYVQSTRKWAVWKQKVILFQSRCWIWTKTCTIFKTDYVSIYWKIMYSYSVSLFPLVLDLKKESTMKELKLLYKRRVLFDYRVTKKNSKEEKVRKIFRVKTEKISVTYVWMRAKLLRYA